MRIALIGRSEILYKSAEALHAAGHEIGLIITSKAAPEYTRSADDFESLAKKLNVPFLKAAKLTNHLGVIKRLPPFDIGISFNYTGILSQEAIACFRLGVLNAHGGDLPRYRGNACQAWAILNGEPKIGLCVHWMVGEQLDAGDIIARDYLPLTENTKIFEVWSWMENRIPQLFVKSLNLLKENPNFILEKQSKNAKDILRCYPRLPEDGRINWKEDSIRILRLINACNKPYDGAFCFYEDKKLTVWDASLFEDNEHYLAVPGQVLKIEDGFIIVATGNGKLAISSVEMDDGIKTPDLFINSIRKRLK